MASPVENILQHLFQTGSIQNVSVEQIQQVINDHPYYDAAYFLLAKKLQSSNESGYNAAIQQAALHFSNPAWLHFNFSNDEQPAIITSQSFPSTTEKEVDINIDEAMPVAEEEIPFIEIPGTEKTSIIETVPTEIIIDDKPAEILAITIEEDDIAEAETEDEQTNEDANNAVSEKLSSILQQQAAAFEKPVEATEIVIENTPYHRVDYFDSQGIKLEDSAANDKLGTQLKRFTDWLKQMKKVNPNQVELANDVAGETQVQHIAQHSNEQEEVVTETMAEVLVKQGKPEQAIQIYEKLSFNNPSKTAYFAAKIQELKG